MGDAPADTDLMSRRTLSLALGALLALFGVAGAVSMGAAPALARSSTGNDFWLATATGDVWNFGNAGSYGSAANLPLHSPIVGITPSVDGAGYSLVASDGGIFAFGDAAYYGSTGAIRLNQPIVGMAPTPKGAGYWLVARDGGIFAFGDAAYYGSTGATKLNQPVVGMAPTHSGHGYWLFASDGGIFAFGDARFEGSTGALHLNQPIVSMTARPDGTGYWLMGADGGVFTFGKAAFGGSMGAQPAPDPAEKVVSTRDGNGYWIVDQNGTAAAFGSASGAPPVQGLMFRAVTRGDGAVLFAFSQLGKPYIWGGNGPVGYDCSGLTLKSWQVAAGITFARVANDQYHTAGGPVPLSDLQTGDLVFWGSNHSDWTSVYHAAMYVGGRRIVESTGNHVQLNSLDQWGTADVMPFGRRP